MNCIDRKKRKEQSKKNKPREDKCIRKRIEDKLKLNEKRKQKKM